MRHLLLITIAAPLLAQVPTINSFTAACSATATPGTSVTCPAGNNDVLAWNVTGATSLSINQSVGSVSPVTTGTATVQPFGVSSITYTLTATNGSGSSTATATITIDDDYARLAALGTTVRAYPFNVSIPCNSSQTGSDPVVAPGESGACDTMTLDTTKAVSGAGSYKLTVPAFAGQAPNGTLTLNFSADGSQTFGEGQEFYVQFREYMDSAFIYNTYMGGGACPADLTLSGVTGTFTAGETVSTSNNAAGKVISWTAGTGRLLLEQSSAYVWYPSAVATGGTSGAHGTVTTNNGAGTAGCVTLSLSSVTGAFTAGETVTNGQTSATGTVRAWSPTLGNLYLIATPINWASGGTGPYVATGGTSGAHGTITGVNYDSVGNTGMKQVMFDPADQPPIPKTSSVGQAPNCVAGHIVTTIPGQNSAGRTYMGCTQVGGFGQYTDLKPRYFASTSPGYLLQSAVACTYADNHTDGVPLNPPCVLYWPNEWMTLQYHVKIGTWYKIAPPGYPTATATFSGGHLTAINITDQGRDWAPGTTITLDGNTDSWLLARLAGGMYSSQDTAVATCAVNNYGQIPSCTITNSGSGAYPTGSWTIRWPNHAGGNFRRDSLIERWQAHAGQPSVLVESLPGFDIVNAQDAPQDWEGGQVGIASRGFPSPPWNYGKAWFTNYATGKDPNAGPYTVANTWIDNFLVGSKRFADPGVAVQPVTNLAITKASYPSVTLTWEHNPDSNGAYNETGFDVERCPKQMADCIAGSSLVSGATWTTVASNTGAGTLTYTETLPSSSTIYTYRVRAVGANSSDWSNPISTAVHPPSDLGASWSGSNVVLTWKQRDDVGSFAVERCAGVFQYKNVGGAGGPYPDEPNCLTTGSNLWTLPTGTVPFAEIANNISGSSNGATITWTDTTATPGTVYSYRVRSHNAAGSWRNWDAGYGTWSAYTANVIPAASAPSGVAPTITTASLPAGTVGTAYSQTLTATGDTPTWSVIAGGLPTGLSLNSSTGAITGTPSTATGSPFSFTVQASNATGTDSKALSITINAAPAGASRTFTGVRR